MVRGAPRVTGTLVILTRFPAFAVATIDGTVDCQERYVFEIAVFAGSGNRIVGLRDIPTSLVLMVTMMNDHVSSWHISLSLSHAQALLADLGWQKLVARFLTQNLTGGCAGTVPLN